MKTLLLFILLSATGAAAHEGHDHGPALPAIAAAQSGPRATAESEEYELVAALEAGTLSLYLDRYASNEPVSQASIEVESGAFKAVAQAAGAGVYQVSGAAFAQPGKYSLTFTVQDGDNFDLLATSLDVPASPAVAGASPASADTVWRAWGPIAGALVLGLLALLAAVTLWRRRA